jgi:predicted TIM-barrel fold metal-dependent hydrolase
MILDGHIHIRDAAAGRERFAAELQRAGIDGGIVISLPPAAYRTQALSASERLDNALAWCAANRRLYPFHWIDPLEDNALEQVAEAVSKGIAGFKIICHRHAPGDERAMPIYRAIAATRRPILFHSGILWDGKASSRFNRPAEFEALLEVSGLRFCLAHIAWPWCDECIAVYGKFLNARATRGDEQAAEMFIDVTPGTPPIYRREALTKLYLTGYDVRNNVIFGSDSCVNEYHTAWVREWLERDAEILRDIGLDSDAQTALRHRNLQRFVGETNEALHHDIPRPGL